MILRDREHKSYRSEDLVIKHVTLSVVGGLNDLLDAGNQRDEHVAPDLEEVGVEIPHMIDDDDPQLEDSFCEKVQNNLAARKSLAVAGIASVPCATRRLLAGKASRYIFV